MKKNANKNKFNKYNLTTMKMTNLIISMAATVSLLLAACSPSSIVNSCVNGNVSVHNGKESDATVKKQVRISDFDGIDAQQGIKVVFSQGQNPGSASIATTPSAEKYLRVEVKDRTLHVYYGGNCKDKIQGPSIITVSSPVLNEVDLSSAARLEINSDLNIDGDLDIDISSAASFNAGTVKCAKMDIDASSASESKIGNLVGNASVDASSSASVWIEMLEGISVDIEASSASKVTLDNLNCERIEAEASSAGKINLSGTTRAFSKDSSSGARINHSSLTVKP